MRANDLFRRLLNPFTRKPMLEPGFHSAFGGLWIDRSDWREELAARSLPHDRTAEIEHFAEKGFVVLEGACPPTALNAFQQDMANAFREGRKGILYQNDGDGTNRELDKPIDQRGVRVVDAYVPLTSALDLFASERLVTFLTTIFDDKPLLHQSLSFHKGSEQGLHQDTAYVVVDRPLELAACWIALEDIKEGAGELIYVPGSHRQPEFLFGEGRKHWDQDVDGLAPHDQWCAQLREQGKALGTQRFLAKRGDILIWHADLAHGGAPIADQTMTRQSLVGHFCPLSARPRYFDHGPVRDAIRFHGPIAYASHIYEI